DIGLDGARLNLTIDEFNQTNWPSTVKLGVDPVTFTFEDASLAFADRRNDQAFTLANADLAVEASPDGALAIEGALPINDQFVSVTGFIRDFMRIAEGGSPANLEVKSAGLTASFDGRVTTSEALGLAGRLLIAGDDFRRTLRWIGAAPGGTSGLSITGALDSSGRALAIRNADLTLDGIRGRGHLTGDFRASPPKFAAAIATADVALDPYLPQLRTGDGGWGLLPLGLATLRGLDADLTWNAQSLSVGEFRTGPVAISARLANGRLETQLQSASLPSAKIVLDGAGDVARLALALRSAEPASFLGDLLGFARLTGKGTFDLALAAEGQNEAEMISTLKGQFALAMSEGTLAGLDLSTALAAVGEAIQNGWPGGGKGEIPFASFDLRAEIADGIAKFSRFEAGNGEAVASASGEADLLRRALDLRVWLKSAKTEKPLLPTAIVVQGPWAAPLLYPDIDGILDDPAAAYARLRQAATGKDGSAGATEN
ncbi:MAG: hypothetical protein FJX63_10015, partial [Alphaproteobacteria bacterium]|nr:hypothetical protein [Alphaproteobacteria bacterium]